MKEKEVVQENEKGKKILLHIYPHTQYKMKTENTLSQCSAPAMPIGHRGAWFNIVCYQKFEYAMHAKKHLKIV